jgi:cytochrome b involved in lipid metabolism
LGGGIYAYQAKKANAPYDAPTPVSSTTQTTTQSPTSVVTTKEEKTPAPVTTGTTTTTATTKNFTLADVAKHNTDGDCYTAIDNTVYDLTAWVHKHPGGDKNILRICGIDGTSAFDRKHGSDPRANNVLAGFEIGTIAQ